MSYGISKKEYPEGNKTHNLEDQESTIYSGSALSSLQISQAQPPSHKKGVQSGTGPTVNKEPLLNNVTKSLFYDWESTSTPYAVKYQSKSYLRFSYSIIIRYYCWVWFYFVYV